MKRVAFALLTVFGTILYCEQTFSIVKYIINPYRNRLTEENSEMCIKLKLQTINQLLKCWHQNLNLKGVTNV